MSWAMACTSVWPRSGGASVEHAADARGDRQRLRRDADLPQDAVGAETDAQRKVLLAGKVEDMINTVVRQIAFYDFECKLHAARREGELTPEDINALWMSVQAESLGPVFEFMPGYETFWAYIPHFVHSPFYVYAYAFGDGLVNALYAVYEEGGEGFQEKYFDMLKAGGSKHHKDLLAPFGLDASDPAFWDKGLGMIEGFIDQLEALEVRSSASSTTARRSAR
jgi:oligoendopeptidase F